MAVRSRQSVRATGSPTRPRSVEKPPIEPGRLAEAGGVRLRSYQVGALPVINRFLRRMKLEELLRQHLPPDDPRTELPTARALLVLVRNLLVSREPIYGVGEWAVSFAPDVLDLYHDELPLLQDDRLGRCLDRMFDGGGPEFILAVTRQVVREFQVSLDELHNDSTTVSFYGAYDEAREEGTLRGRPTHAITWGHSKARRPDLKQLLYTLTVTEDGGVPVYFSSGSGNVVDDQTHIATWDLLCQLVGHPDFLYVADCKLASRENLGHLARRGGRFVTILPRTRREDEEFRARLRQNTDAIRWAVVYEVKEGDVVRDELSTCQEELASHDGYRLLWYRSTRKQELDRIARQERIHRAIGQLRELGGKLSGPRTRYRARAKVEAAVAKILDERDVAAYLTVGIAEQEQATYKQARRGRPNSQTPYVRHTRPQCELSWEVNTAALEEAERDDGVFPLLTNDRRLTAEQVLRAYKRQPLIEKRFSQFKTDFAVAPVYLKNVARIQGLLAVYFLVLLVQTLLERELRQSLARSGEASLPLDPESRPCRRPTTRRVLDVLEPIQRHVVALPDGTEHTLATELTPLQRQLISLLGLPADGYGVE